MDQHVSQEEILATAFKDVLNPEFESMFFKSLKHEQFDETVTKIRNESLVETNKDIVEVVDFPNGDAIKGVNKEVLYKVATRYPSENFMKKFVTPIHGNAGMNFQKLPIDTPSILHETLSLPSIIIEDDEIAVVDGLLVPWPRNFDKNKISSSSERAASALSFASNITEAENAMKKPIFNHDTQGMSTTEGNCVPGSAKKKNFSPKGRNSTFQTVSPRLVPPMFRQAADCEMKDLLDACRAVKGHLESLHSTRQTNRTRNSVIIRMIQENATEHFLSTLMISRNTPEEVVLSKYESRGVLEIFRDMLANKHCHRYSKFHGMGLRVSKRGINWLIDEPMWKVASAVELTGVSPRHILLQGKYIKERMLHDERPAYKHEEGNGCIWYSKSLEEWNVGIGKGTSSVAMRVGDSLAETPDKVGKKWKEFDGTKFVVKKTIQVSTLK